mgnify:CR=1 FL=1|jgi:hypothetical protein
MDRTSINFVCTVSNALILPFMMLTYASMTTNLSWDALELISLNKLSQILRFSGWTALGLP